MRGPYHIINFKSLLGQKVDVLGRFGICLSKLVAFENFDFCRPRARTKNLDPEILIQNFVGSVASGQFRPAEFGKGSNFVSKSPQRVYFERC